MSRTKCTTIKEGIIIEKWHEDPVSSMGIISTGKIVMPTYIFDDEDFVVIIEGFNKKGILKSQKYYISEVAYDTVFVGSWFCATKYCDTRDH